MELVSEPVQALVQAIAVGGAARHDEPLAVAHLRQAEFIRDDVRGRRVGQILLVGEDKQHGVGKLLLLHHLVQLLARLGEALGVVAVDDEDDALRVLEVMAPEWADLVLPTDIPHGEVDVFVLH